LGVASAALVEGACPTTVVSAKPKARPIAPNPMKNAQDRAPIFI
jgi:hypothetical protein